MGIFLTNFHSLLTFLWLNMKRSILIVFFLLLVEEIGSFGVKWYTTYSFHLRSRMNDIDQSFSSLDKILFNRFSASVSDEIEEPRTTTYTALINQISDMTIKYPLDVVHTKGKRMLTKLFPSWLLSQYKWMFATPFPRFSAWMNAWVTHLATNWLMGNSTVVDLQLVDGVVLEQQGLLVEKCRFLETAGCVSTCINACKIPTQRFFMEEMGLPVTLKPNITDFSCTFEFGIKPGPLMFEASLADQDCLTNCSSNKRYSSGICKKCLEPIDHSF